MTIRNRFIFTLINAPTSTCSKTRPVTFYAFKTASCYLNLSTFPKLAILFTSWNFYSLASSSLPDHLICLISYYLRDCSFYLFLLINPTLKDCTRSLPHFENQRCPFSIYFYFLSKADLFFHFFSSLSTCRACCYVNTSHRRLFSTVYGESKLVIIVFFIDLLVIVTFFIFTFFSLLLKQSFVSFFPHFVRTPLILQEELYSISPWFESIFFYNKFKKQFISFSFL